MFWCCSATSGKVNLVFCQTCQIENQFVEVRAKSNYKLKFNDGVVGLQLFNYQILAIYFTLGSRHHIIYGGLRRKKRIKVWESFLPAALNEMSASVSEAICLYQSTLHYKIKTHLANESFIIHHLLQHVHNSVQSWYFGFFSSIESKHSICESVQQPQI